MSGRFTPKFCLTVIVVYSCVLSAVAQSPRRFVTPQAAAQQSSKRPGSSSFQKSYKFLGWKHGATAGQGYLQRFQRPRAGLAQPRVVQNASVARPGSSQGLSSPSSSQSYPGLALRPTLPSGFIPDAVATGDLNGDGKTDWVVANGGDNDLWVYLGNGDGTAALPTILNIGGLGPVSVATGDLRGNGKTDIIVAEADSNSIEVFLGNGDGTFQSPQLYAFTGQPTYVVVADFNKDGNLDLGIAMLGTSPLAVLPGKGDGTFGAPILTSWGGGGAAVISLSVADVNHDGNLDLVFVDEAAGIGLLLGKGNGTFGEPSLIAGDIGEVGLEYFAAAVGDVNEDGCPDVIATDSFAFAELYTGNCDGTFSSIPKFFGAGDIGVSVALQDVNGDGHLDIVAGGDYFGSIIGAGDDAGNLLCVLFGDGTGNFATANVFRSQPGMYSLAFLQLSGASVPSVLAVNEDTDALTLFKNDGTGDFGAPRGRAIGYAGGTSNAPYGRFVIADVNGDNLPDLLNIDVPQYSPGTYQLSTILNQGNGHFGPATFSPLYPDSYYTPGDMAVGDFRNTGHLDVVVVGGIPGTFGGPFLAFAANQGNGTFAPATVVTPPTASGLIGVGDFNRDGKLDFVTLTTGSGGEELNVFLGNGDGTFAPQPPLEWSDSGAGNWPIEVTVGDFNGDGKLDVLVRLYLNIVPYQYNDVYVIYGNGDGTFQQPVKLFDNYDPMTVADVNHNGILDIVTCRDQLDDYPAGTPAANSVLLGKRAGGFASPTEYQPYIGFSFLPDSIGFGPGNQGFCTVADFNGDTNLDIGVMQRGSPYNTIPAYVQFLSGNGDGTFTPTYDIYSFDRDTLPQEFYDLDGDGKADLLEMDGLTSSFNFIPGAVAQQFQLETVTEPITGNTGSAQVSLDAPSSSDTVITLQASDPGLQIPGSVTIPAGKVSQEFTYTVTGQANIHQLFQITATLGSEQEQAYNFVLTDHRVQTGFKFSLVTTSASVYPGLSSTSYQPYYATQPNYKTTLNLSCSGLAPGLSCVFFPPEAILSANSSINGSLIIDAASSAVPGTYNFQVTASDLNSSVTVPASVTVLPPTPILNISAELNIPGIVGNPITIPFTVQNFGDEPAHNTMTTINIPGPQGLQLTSLTASTGSCSLSSQACSLGTVNPGDVITVTATVSPLEGGVQELNLIATDSDNSSKTGADVFIESGDYGMALYPNSLTVNPGSQGTVNVQMQAEGGAFGLPVSLSCSGLPAGATCSFNPATLTPTFSPSLSVLTISVPHSSSTIAAPASRRLKPLFALWLAPFGIVAVIPSARKRSRNWFLLGILLIMLVLALQACGGGGSTPSGGSSVGGGTTSPSNPTYNVTVTAIGSNDKHTATLNLTVP